MISCKLKLSLPRIVGMSLLVSIWSRRNRDILCIHYLYTLEYDFIFFSVCCFFFMNNETSRRVKRKIIQVGKKSLKFTLVMPTEKNPTLMSEDKKVEPIKTSRVFVVAV